MLIVCDILITIFFAARVYTKAWAIHNILVEDGMRLYTVLQPNSD